MHGPAEGFLREIDRIDIGHQHSVSFWIQPPAQPDSAVAQLRRQLRARRLAEKQAQMAAALAEKQARDVQESAETERKAALREENKQRMAAWRQVRLRCRATALAAFLQLVVSTGFLK